MYIIKYKLNYLKEMLREMKKTINDFEKYIDDMNYIYSKKQGLMNAFKKIELWESATNIKLENWKKSF